MALLKFPSTSEWWNDMHIHGESGSPNGMKYMGLELIGRFRRLPKITIDCKECPIYARFDDSPSSDFIFAVDVD
jgi:hypothetical protein